MDRLISDIALGVAIALQDPEVRARLRDDLQASPFPEHKVRLKDYLLSEGRHQGRSDKLSTALTSRSGGKSRLRAALDSLPELALYLPVPAHFKSWAGGTNVLVAAAIKDNTTPFGFELGGNAVPLSASAPPVTPVLAIVPAETDLTREPTPVPSLLIDPPGGGGGGGGGGNPPLPTLPGIWMNRGTVDQNYEGWFMGGPEFEVILTYRAPGAASMTQRQCAGEHAVTSSNQPGVVDPAFVFDWENLTWTGLVQLGTLTQFAQAQTADNGAMFMLVEDDEDACTIRQNAINLNSLINAVRTFGAMTGAIGQKPKNDLGWVVEGVALFVNIVSIGTFFNPDDIVGVFVDKPFVIPCPVPSGHTHAIVKDGQCKGFVNVLQKLN